MRKRFLAIPFILLLTLSSLSTLFAQASGIKETVLPNGLKVITKEVHAAPVVSFQVWYKVGSRNERLGKTGISHLLEHMQFKGTKTLKKGDIDLLISRNGGMMNAATWKDYTMFWETLSSDKLWLAMRIESDRMVNSALDPKELVSEKVVVRSELEGRQNDPDSELFNELYSTAYEAHPYEWPTVGWLPDLISINREDLYRYYKTFYMPNNATVVIVGDFQTAKALAMVRKYFGGIPRGPEPPTVTAVEPVQKGGRTTILHEPASAYRVIIGYHIPALSDPDNYTLSVIDAILSAGQSSRLYKALVDNQLATQAWSNPGQGRDPELFLVGATARDGVKISDVQSALLSEVGRMKTEEVTDEELQKAVNQLEAQFIYANDSVSNQGEELGTYETVYTWKYLDSYLPSIRKVTKADIQRVAKKYFVDDNQTVATYIPDTSKPYHPSAGGGMGPMHYKPTVGLSDGGTGRQEDEKTRGQEDGNVGLRDLGTGGTGGFPNTQRLTPNAQHPILSAQRLTPNASLARQLDPLPALGTADPRKPTRVILDNGMVVIVQENRSNPTVAVYGSLNAGSDLQPMGKYDLAEMTAGLILKGTNKRTADQISSAIDFAGMSLSTTATVESTTFSGYALSKNFDQVLDLLSDSLENATFPQSEIDKARNIRLSDIKAQQDDVGAMAMRTFMGTAFPENNPFYVPSIDTETTAVSGITRNDIVNFYNANYGPSSTILVVVGDVNTDEAIAKIKSHFGDWKGNSQPKRPDIPNTPVTPGIQRRVISMPDKSQVQVVIGYPGQLRRTDPDFYEAQVMNFILGGGGALNSRMGHTIRDVHGLVYEVNSGFEATLGAGPWVVELGSNPKNVDKAISGAIEQMKLMKDKGATQAELKDAVDYMTGSFPVRLETNQAVATVLHSSELYGLGLDYMSRYEHIYRSVTLKQVNEAAKKYLHPDSYTIAIAGPYADK
jgi:zinc protease